MPHVRAGKRRAPKILPELRKMASRSEFPAKKEGESQEKIGRGFGGIIAILIIIGAIWYFNGNSNGLLSNKVVFDAIDVGSFTFTQLEITPGTKSSIPVDLTVREASSDPIEIAAVFYDENGNRIGRASTILTHELPAGYTTTLNLKLDEPVSLMNARTVRIEVTPLGLIQLLEKTAERLEKIPGT